MGAPEEFHPEVHEKAKEITGDRNYGEWGQCVAERNKADKRCKGYALGPHGKCHNHGGKSTGAPEKNQNAQRHGLFSKHDGYYHELDDEAQNWVFDFTHTLLDRLRERQGTEPDMFDREALKNIAIDFHRVAHANGWFAEEGLVHEEIVRSENFEKEETKINVWASEIRQYNESIYRRMQKHGLLDDPESAKADAMAGLKDEWKASASQ